jgi:hypothetical protein
LSNDWSLVTGHYPLVTGHFNWSLVIARVIAELAIASLDDTADFVIVVSLAESR